MYIYIYIYTHMYMYIYIYIYYNAKQLCLKRCTARASRRAGSEWIVTVAGNDMWEGRRRAANDR